MKGSGTPIHTFYCNFWPPGLKNIVRSTGEFVIKEFVISGFCSIHFIITLTSGAELRTSFVIPGNSLERVSLYWVSTVLAGHDKKERD